jgi:NADH:ubiquinone oxidoreductase subunit 6 (subunit J)
MFIRRAPTELGVMTAPRVTFRTEDVKGARRIATGASLGIVAAAITLVLPLALLWIALYGPGHILTLNATLVEAISVLILAGAILFLLSLFLYRLGFAALRAVDPRFTAASILCVVGSIGFLLLLVAVAVVLGSTTSLLNCIGGQPSHALSCLRSGQPLGAYTGLLGFWLGWLGGVGLVLGLASAGRRFARGALYGGSIIYSLLLLVLVGPFLALVYPVPGAGLFLLALPVLALLAPALALAGARRPPVLVKPA